MKKIINWLKNPASDFTLLAVLLILANLVGKNAFFRIDLTRPKSYSLSEASKQLVSTLDMPLSIRVFFSDNLPAPYSTTSQYVKDILVEYKGEANNNFSYSIMDMKKQESEQLASDYGLRQIQIQQLANNEVGFKQAYMGLVISYADSIEVLDGIVSSDSFEYKLTTKISKMISTANTLAGLNETDKVKLTLYATNALSQFQIAGFDELDSIVKEAYENVNKQNMDKIEYAKVNPTKSEIENIKTKYGVQIIDWKESDNTIDSGALGLVLEYKDSFRLIPLSMQRSLFGYAISGLDEVEKNISDSLQSLFSKSVQIGYITGHGERELYSQQGQLPLSSVISDMYSFVEINLSEDNIPTNVTSIVINGAKTEYKEEELYKIDQFIMKGGNVMFFVDPFDTQGDIYYQQPTFAPYTTNLNKLLNAYGIKPELNYVMDENCYTQQDNNYGKISLWYAPVIPNEQLAKKSEITSNLGRIIFYLSSAINTETAENNKNLKVTKLVNTSPSSWIVSDNIINALNAMSAPQDKTTQKSETLSVLVEGKFTSAFEKELNSEQEGNLSTTTHLKESVQQGKIFVAGTSEITGESLMDAEGSEPIAMFTRNVIDYMNGNSELCKMRTKGLTLNTLKNTNSTLAIVVQYFNEFGIAALVIIFGLIVWKMREAKRQRIHDKYNPNDTRTITKKATTSENISKEENNE